MAINPRSASEAGKQLGIGKALGLCALMCTLGIMFSSATGRPYGLLMSVFGSGAVLAGASAKNTTN